MMRAQRAVRGERAGATREQILSTAERLFAEHGVYAVSNRQVSEAAGQGNNTAVTYHFGGKVELIQAIAGKHSGPIEDLRTRMVAELDDSADLRAWVACLVRPITDHLARLAQDGGTTWFARFSAQIMTDPALRDIMIDEGLSAPSMHQILHGVQCNLPAQSAEVRAERADMARQLMVHMCAERERALADGTSTRRASWQDTGTGLIDAITALWRGPVSTE
jgi:AcrR family transcriptional regulator